MRSQNTTKRFTEKHKQIMIRVGQGKEQKEIAAELGGSHRTIGNHIMVICDVLKARNKTHALLLAIKQGYIDLEEIKLSVEA